MKKNNKTNIGGLSLKSVRKRVAKNKKRHKNKILKRFDIDPETHPLFIYIPRRPVSINTERIEKIIEEARKRDRRKYLKNVKKLLEDDNDFEQ